MTENTAAVTALETAAKALTDAVTALRTVPSGSPALTPFFVGQEIGGGTDALNALPIGTVVEDRDGDPWTKRTETTWAFRSSQSPEDVDGLTRYLPARVMTLPGAPAAEPAPALPTVALTGYKHTFTRDIVSRSSGRPIVQVKVEQSVLTSDGAQVFVRVKNQDTFDAVQLHITREEAREIAAALLAVADL